uniref:Uncharacterized protein n=1 Tax=Knipowitschia caucasica TaxID=637954 RepID=A0AAV2M538_KNICA
MRKTPAEDICRGTGPEPDPSRDQSLRPIIRLRSDDNVNNVPKTSQSARGVITHTMERTQVMAELAFYPAVALLYFFGVMRASKEDKVELDDRASLNVFLLFVLAQPLCLVIGGYTGMATYLLTAGVSYYWLPWRREARTGDRSPGKKDKRKKTE